MENEMVEYADLLEWYVFRSHKLTGLDISGGLKDVYLVARFAYLYQALEFAAEESKYQTGLYTVVQGKFGGGKK